LRRDALPLIILSEENRVEELSIALFGLIIGSFLNVCIVRIPYEESVVSPGSRCPKCEQGIAWYDNIPVLSYLALLGKCRNCSERIPIRYPVVEILTAVLAVALYRLDLPPQEFALFAAYTAALIVITFIDIDHKIIPDVISIPSIMIAPGMAFVVNHITIMDSLIGILAGGGVLWAIARGYELIRKHEGMGLGDVKMLAMIGGFQGWEAVPFTLLVGSLIGTVVGIGAIIARRGKLDMEIPFGPFLAAGSLLYLFDGPRIISAYFDMSSFLF
jgi:leader peptidase (prepilin peptidase)/N-methyltransferase